MLIGKRKIKEDKKKESKKERSKEVFSIRAFPLIRWSTEKGELIEPKEELKKERDK